MKSIKTQFQRKYYFIAPLFILLFFLSFKAKSGDKDLLDPQSTYIVLPDRPASLEVRSASLLYKWLNKIYKTDAGFRIVKESAIKIKDVSILLEIGNTKSNLSEDLNNQPPASFVIKRISEKISIKGQNALGTFLGAVYFLDHVCGVRFYLPGDLFTSLPPGKKVMVDKEISASEIPFTKYVFSTGYKNSDEANWAQRNGLVRKDFESHQHSMGERFYDDSIFKMFPEIFPLVNGQRYFPKSKSDQKWEPDFAEPKLVDAAVYSAIKYFKKNPQYDYISFSVQDSRIYPTEGKMGDFLNSYPNDEEGKKRAYTDAYVAFLNKLAVRLEKELPANGIMKPKTIIYLVYGYVRMVPLVKLNPNILPVTVFQISGSLMSNFFKDDGVLKDWSKVTSRIGNHDWAEGMGFIYPRIYTNLLSEFLKTIQKDKMEFEFAHLEMYPNWALDGPKNYFMGKIYWNPGVNTDSLLTLFCNDMFGKSAGQMKNYFSTLENLGTSMNNNQQRRRGIRAYLTQLPLDDNELSMVHQARQYIDNAYSIAQTDEEKKRIEFFSDGFKISEGFFEIYNSKTVDMNKVDELKNYLKNTVAGNKMMLSIAGDSNFVSTMNGLLDNIIKKKAGGK